MRHIDESAPPLYSQFTDNISTQPKSKGVGFPKFGIFDSLTILTAKDRSKHSAL